ncbi:MAG: helix-turn-helix transcriptional regulator [Candidatus Kapaibacterium sp.]
MAAIMTPTKGESLLLWRRRKGLNQVQAASEYNVHPDRYREWEADRRTEDQPRQHLGELKPHELCVLARRRAGQTQRQVAAAIGLTRLWVTKIENGEASPDRLQEYWGLNK